MPFRTCDHLKEDGLFCSSPALRDQRYCYFHLNARARRVGAELAKLHGEPFRLLMPILDNMHSVLAGIQQVLDALAANRISARVAAAHLHGLQQAAAALKSIPQSNGSRPELPAGEPLSVLEVGTLNDRYGLPFDTNLDIPPDVAVAEIVASAPLPLDARLHNLKQPYFARVPAHPESAVPDPAPSNPPRLSQKPAAGDPIESPPASSVAAPIVSEDAA